MKPNFREVAWFFLTSITFLVLTLLVEGPGYGRGLDFESCLTLSRFLRGDPLSLIVQNFSPVVQYSIPYDGWPPLFTWLKAFWLIFNMPISHCHLYSGMVAIAAFGIATVYLVKKLNPGADLVLVFMISMLSPVAMNHVTWGIRHILIPFAAIFPLILVPVGPNISKKQYVYAVVAGFFLGLITWHAYFIVPALLCFILIPSKYKPSINYSNPYFIKWVAALAAGFLLAFVSFKIITTIDYYRNLDKIVYVFEGSTFHKFIGRIYGSPFTIPIAIYLSITRAFFSCLPLMLLILIIKLTKTGVLDKFNNNLKYIFGLSVLSPLLFIIVFNVQVFPSTHSMESLAFLAPVSIFASKVVVKDSYKNLIYSVFLLILFSLSLFAFKGNLLLPDSLLLFSGHRGYESPLEPGNYDLSLKPIDYSLYSLIKSIKNQITLLPACHPRLVKVNAYNRTMNNFRIYGNYIRAATSEDEIIIMFGDSFDAASFYCQRVILGVDSIKTFLEKLKEFNRKNFKVALLVPKDSSLKFMDELNLSMDYDARVELIENTPYKIIHLGQKNKQ